MIVFHLCRHGLVPAAALAFVGAALAEPGAASPEPPASMQAFGAANANCREWTNSCLVCRRLEGAEREEAEDGEEGEIACSTPGVACLPGEIVCKAAAGAPMLDSSAP